MEITSNAQFYYQQSKVDAYLKPSSSLSASDEKKLKDSCRDFEAMFIKQMLSSMKNTIQKTGMMGKENSGEKIFTDMLYDKYAESMADTAGFGIADQLYKEMASL